MDLSSLGAAGVGYAVAQEAPIARPVSEDQRALIQAVKAVSGAEFFGPDNELTFAVDRSSRKAIVRLVNRQTHEVVEQIPAEYILRLAEELNRG